MDDIDDMTENEIEAAMKKLHDLKRQGKMTPRQARRLEQLRAASRTITHARKPVYWL